MSWTLGGTQIIVTDLETDDNGIIARHNTLGGGTVLHKYGYEDKVVTLKCIVIGTGDMGDLLDMIMTSGEETYELIGPWGTEGDYHVSKISTDRAKWTCQTIRPDLDETAKVWYCDIELYQGW